MKISLIKIRNVLGITECEIRPGRITEIQGKLIPREAVA